jgi:methenyltetrahydromethanopterin cyclohydrolase
MIQLNERAWNLLQQALPEGEALGWQVSRTSKGMLRVDAGCQTQGSLAAGLRMAEIGMAGLGQAHLALKTVCGIPWPVVEVRTSQPVTACLLSQAAHWPVAVGLYKAMGSGPACLLRKDSLAAQEFHWKENPKRGVLILEAPDLPDEAVCHELAETCEVRPDELALIVAPTSSPAGSVQIAARSVETGLHKLHHIGFDLSGVVDAVGQCPLAGPAGDDRTAMGKTNDVMMFGSQVWLSVRWEAHAGPLAEWILKVPASASASYGVPFLEAVELAGGFYKLDPGLFAPAEIVMTDIANGEVYRAGCVDEAALKSVLGI